MTTNDQHTDVPHDRDIDQPYDQADVERPQFRGTGDDPNGVAPDAVNPSDQRRAPMDSVSTQPMPAPTEDAQPSRQPEPAGSGLDDQTSSEQALFASDDLSGLRSKWDNVQAAFVDDPKACVAQADTLVSEVVDQLTRGFSDTRAHLEAQWARGEQASTEDLRVALTQYREFFQRLLAV